jgi:membrane protein YqaA with SNARE-associated domain
MRSLSRRLVGIFGSPLGLFVLAALDGTVFFSLPFGVDAVVIILTARLRDTASIVPVLATAGSATGAALTFWMGVNRARRHTHNRVSRSRASCDQVDAPPRSRLTRRMRRFAQPSRRYRT